MADTPSLLNIDTTIEQLNETSFKRLTESGLSASPGKIARLMLAILNENISGFFTVLKEQHAQVFLSQATGDSLNMIGQMFNCTRNVGESDDDYKYRISKQNLTLATANQTALRLALLSVEGVQDVVMRPYTRGTGSFSVYIVTENSVVDEDTMAAVNAVLEEMKAYGIRASAYSPDLLPIEYRGRIIFDKKVADLDRRMMRLQAQQLIREYISTLSVGGTFNPNTIRNQIIALSDGVYDFQVYYFRLGNRPALVTPQEAAWNERFIEAQIPDAILVS